MSRAVRRDLLTENAPPQQPEDPMDSEQPDNAAIHPPPLQTPPPTEPMSQLSNQSPLPASPQDGPNVGDQRSAGNPTSGKSLSLQPFPPTIRRERDGSIAAPIGQTLPSPVAPSHAESTTLWNPASSSLTEEEPARRRDTDSGDGKIRYFGPTTRLHIQSHSNELQEVQEDVSIGPESIDNMDSPQVKKSIPETMWKYFTLAVVVVDKDLFMAPQDNLSSALLLHLSVVHLRMLSLHPYPLHLTGPNHRPGAAKDTNVNVFHQKAQRQKQPMTGNGSNQ